MEKFDFENLFVLDLANNHQGSIEHGLNVINSHSAVINELGVRAGIKFQFRNIPDFVHPEDQKQSDNKHVPRFLSTKLEWDQYQVLVNQVKENGLLTICTPFDEFSVDKIVELGFDVIKVASCSAKDWPLLNKVAKSGLPIIASTGGLTLEEVDRLVTFFQYHNCDFSLMHCVAIYPTPSENCNLSTITEFKNRYKGVTIGWSTHEDQNDTMPVTVAVGLGAKMFERHIGVETEHNKLNAYSSTPEQTRLWVEGYLKANTLLGSPMRDNITELEEKSLNSLKRGVFANRNISEGETITSDDVYFAFPYREGQISSGEFMHGIATKDIIVDEDISDINTRLESNKEYDTLLDVIAQTNVLLNKANVVLTNDCDIEYSHHYGLENFFDIGTTLITVVNKDYAKKILVQLENQSHPLHMHKLKEETFIVLYGTLVLEVDGVEHLLKTGDKLTVYPNTWHKFYSETGCVFEEISTTALRNDSYYSDPTISVKTHEQRKTKASKLDTYK